MIRKVTARGQTTAIRVGGIKVQVWRPKKKIEERPQNARMSGGGEFRETSPAQVSDVEATAPGPGFDPIVCPILFGDPLLLLVV